MLEDGRYASISEIATAEKIDRGYVGSMLRLTLVAPDIVEAILDGRQPPGLGLPTLLKPFAGEWARQRIEMGTCPTRRIRKLNVLSRGISMFRRGKRALTQSWCSGQPKLRCPDQTRSQQIEIGATIHLPLDQF